MTPPAFTAKRITIDPDCEAAYDALEAAARSGKKPQQGIWRRFEAAVERVRIDPLWGEVIRRDAIPAYFVERYDVTNLYCVDLKGDVRCFYTIHNRVLTFLDIVDHEQYDKWFPPKGRKARR